MREHQKFLHIFSQKFFIYLSDITNVLFLNTVSLLLNPLCPPVYKLFKDITMKYFPLCPKPVKDCLLHLLLLLLLIIIIIIIIM
jgi:hypothetical protein